MDREQSNRPFSYAVAIFVVLVSTLLTRVLSFFMPLEHIGRPLPHISLFFAAVAISTWWGGLRTGALTIFLSTLLIECVLMPLAGVPSWDSSAIFRIVSFLLVAVIIHSLYVERQKAENALRVRVQLARLESEISSALVQARPLPEVLRECALIIRNRLDTLAVAVWLYDDSDNATILEALSHDELPKTKNHRHFLLSRMNRFACQGKEVARHIRHFELQLAEQKLGMIVISSVAPLSALAVRSMHQIADDVSQATARWQAAQALETQARMLAAARDTAEREAQARLKLIGSFSHEVRNPMSGILGLTRMLMGTELSPEQKTLVQSIQDSGQSLLAVINSVLDMARLEEGKVVLAREIFDLREVVEQTVEMLAPNACEKQLGLFVRYAPDTPRHFIGDPVRMRQILLNLCSNAIKFTHQGHVFLEIDCGDPHAAMPLLYITVQDTGIGIPEDKLAAIFDRYNQGSSRTAQRYGGSGLGLSICKQLTAAMGGSITVQSKVGVGSTFRLSIPLLQHRQETHPQQNRALQRLSGKSALVIDTNPINQQILVEQLRSWGMTVTAYDSASTAAAHLENSTLSCFDVLLTDQHLPHFIDPAASCPPGFSGATLRILLGSITQVQQLRNDVKSGRFHALLTKPIRSSQLLDVVVSGLFPQEDVALVKQIQKLRMPTCGVDRVGRVLIVEDNYVNQNLARWELEKLGWDVEVADHGIVALEMLTQQPFDLVLMDCQMPEMDGYETAMEIRRREADGRLGRRRIPIIAVTAEVMPGARERCLEAGMDDFIGKPLEADRLGPFLSRFLDPDGGQKTTTTAETASTDSPNRIVARSLDDQAIALFENEYPRLLERLRRARHTSTRDEIARTAHVIKGIAMYFHAEPVIHAAAALELAARSQNSGTPAAEIQALTTALEHLAGEMRTLPTGIHIK